MARTTKTASAAGTETHRGRSTGASKVRAGNADAAKPAASHRTATHRTDPAETQPSPEGRREGSP